MIQKKRHLAKAITWRAIATTTTFLIAYAVSDSFALGASIASFDVLLKTALYYWHERLWYKTRWGVES
jgi:uncharacterized membrane protein